MRMQCIKLWSCVFSFSQPLLCWNMFLFLFFFLTFFFNQCSILGETPSKSENLEGVVKTVTLWFRDVLWQLRGYKAEGTFFNVGCRSGGRGHLAKNRNHGCSLWAHLLPCVDPQLCTISIAQDRMFLYCNSSTYTSSKNTTVSNCWERGFVKFH